MKIVAIVHTEYHLILLINEILKNPAVNYDVYIIHQKRSKRLKSTFDFSPLINAKFEIVEITINLKGYFSIDHSELINSICYRKYNKFYFFQETNPIVLSIIKTLNKSMRSCEICMFQDGMKPYSKMKGYSLGMLTSDIKIWRWLWNNGIREIKPLKLLHTKNYAYSDEVDVLHLTFPKSYFNWNDKKLKEIQFYDHGFFKIYLERVFGWDDTFLKVKDNIILYMTQPAHQDPIVEFEFLRKLKIQLNKPLVLKLHPLTTPESVDKYKSIADDVFVLNSQIPAEIYIMNMTESVIISLNSTSMFYNSPTNRYYFVSNLFRNKIKLLRRYDFKESPCPHITMVNRIEDII